MVLTTERAEKLTKYLTDDIDRAKRIFALPLSEATRAINADGHDYTEEELKDYAEYIRISFSNEEVEVCDADLEEIFGGTSVGSILVAMSILLRENKPLGWFNETRLGL